MIESPQTRPTVRLLPRRHKRAQKGHPWIYANEIAIDNAAKKLPAGALVSLAAQNGDPVGTGTFNIKPLISARVLSPDPEATIDKDFFGARLASAKALRDALYDAPYYRLVHSEADGLPGLIVDRFGDTLVCQFNTAGMARLEDTVLAALAEACPVERIVLRNDSAARALEGLAEEVRLARGSLDGPVALEENGATVFADPLAGQKTGWFFDQRETRAYVAALCRGRSVLDLYCYAGGFAVQAARAGARAVLGIDRSAAALALAARGAEASGVVARCTFRRGDVFSFLAEEARAERRYDVVFADPPAFVKSKRDLHAGARGYRKMTRLAAELVAAGGFLMVASCSHNVSVELFAEQARRGLHEAGRNARLLRSAGAAPDHPVHPFLPESAYLKSLLFALD